MLCITKEIKDKISVYMEDKREEMIKMLEDLIRIPSVMGAPLPGAPYGEGPARMLEKAEEIFKSEGLPTDKKEEYLLSGYGDGEKTIGIFAHGDVVPPGDGWVLTDPFSPVIRDGFIVGRGSGDNKCGFVEMLYAVKAIRELRLPLKSRLCLFVGTNEESGMEDIKVFAAREEMPAASIVPDGAFPYICGEKGRAVLYLDSEKPFSFIREIRGGDSVNRVLDFAKVRMPFVASVYEALSGKEGITVQKTDDEILVTAKGLPAHASMPWLGDNAFAKLAKALADCEGLPEDDRAILKEAAAFAGGIYGEGFGIEREDAVFGKLTSTCGIANTENGPLSLSIDIRFGGNFCEEIVKKLSALPGWSARPVDVSDGYMRKEDPVGRALGAVYHDYTGKGEEGDTMGIGTYARHLVNAFPTGICVRTKKGPSLPAGHGEAHQADEILEIDGFIEATKILTCMILETDAVLQATK